jgi:hypothetical protein
MVQGKLYRNVDIKNIHTSPRPFYLNRNFCIRGQPAKQDCPCMAGLVSRYGTRKLPMALAPLHLR